MSFPCTGCGVCCQHAGTAVTIARKLLQSGNRDAYVQEIADFPYEFSSTGRCSQLGEGNQCAVYEDRPLVCSVDRVWEKYQSGGMSKSEYYQSTAMLCNSMMVEAHTPPSYFIDPKIVLQ
jgi:Fe-S-cluster containining protein